MSREGLEVSLHCAFCHDSTTAMVAASGWRVRCGVIEDEHALCPKHALVEEFFKDQCPGCVAGWPDCPLYRAFAYSRNRTMGEPDFDSLRRGVCPKRVNGSFGVTNDHAGVKITEVNISTVSQAGAVIESAIREYMATYPENGAANG